MSQGETNSISRPAQDRVKTLKILSLVFGLIGAVMLVVALLIFLFGTVFTSYTAQTEGTVVSLQVRSDKSSNNTQAPVVDYVIDGKKYTYYSAIYSSLSLYKVGDKMLLHYDPANPQNVQAEFGVGQLLSLIFGFIGFCFVLSSGLMWFIRFRLLQKQNTQLT